VVNDCLEGILQKWPGKLTGEPPRRTTSRQSQRRPCKNESCQRECWFYLVNRRTTPVMLFAPNPLSTVR
jgi:hypothetical protein